MLAHGRLTVLASDQDVPEHRRCSTVNASICTRRPRLTMAVAPVLCVLYTRSLISVPSGIAEAQSDLIVDTTRDSADLAWIRAGVNRFPSGVSLLAHRSTGSPLGFVVAQQHPYLRRPFRVCCTWSAFVPVG